MARSVPNPYVGPRAFEEKDSRNFFGRKEESRQLASLVVAQRAVLLYAPSGAGKTSLLNASLIPHLKQRKRIVVLPISRVGGDVPPGVDKAQVKNAYVFNALLSLAEETVSPGELIDLTLSEGLRDHFSSQPGERRVRPRLLILDQFEEIFTTHPDRYDERAGFFSQLQRSLIDYPQLSLLLSMREDYIALLDSYVAQLPDRLRTRFRLEFLQQEAALLAIQQPARLTGGVDFVDSAAKELVDDLRRVRVQRPDGSVEEQTGPHIEPVQLQVVCRRLWDRLPATATRIEKSDVEAIGDVDTALSGYYAERVAAIAGGSGIRERTIRDWFDRRLITEQGIRGQVLQGLEYSGGLDNRAIWPLVDAHLVRAEKRRGATWFELAHDRLIEPVRADNAAWREAHLGTLERQAALWESESRPDGLLLGDEMLAEVEAWAEAHADEMTSVERAFLEECQEARMIAGRERQRNRLIRWLAVGASFLAVVAVVLAIFAWGQKNGALEAQATAEVQRRIATSRAIAAAAIKNLDVDPERSILLALQAVWTTYTEDNTVTNEAEDALRQAVQASRVRLTLTGHTDIVRAVIFSPKGMLLATASDDHTAKVWDTTSGKELFTVEHVAPVTSVAFNLEGTRLATASGDGAVKVWDTASGTEQLALADGQWVTSVAFSPDGTRLATASVDGTVKVWDATFGTQLLDLFTHADVVRAVTFSPDGERLATASDDQTAKVWNAMSGEQLLTLYGHTYRISGIAFSPDGKRLATASDDHTVRIWEVESGEALVVLRGHTSAVFGVAFSADGTHLATVSADQTAKGWDIVSGRELFTLYGHTGPVNSVAFGPDGKCLATASSDGTVRVWNAAFGHAAAVNGVAFRPDGTHFATASSDWTAKVWDIETGQESFTFIGHVAAIRSVAFNPDGMRLATASDDRTTRIWDATSGTAVLTLTGHIGGIKAVSFSPDGTRLATASEDGSAKIWDASSGIEICTLGGHDAPVTGISFSPDGMQLATTGGDGSIMVWSTESCTDSLSLFAPAWITGVAFSPDGSQLATTHVDRVARVWDIASVTMVLTLTHHTNIVNGVAFSPDGTRLATASSDKSVRIWDVASGKELLALGHTAEVYGVAFSPDGIHLVTTTSDGKIYLHLLQIEELITLAQRRVTRSLTPVECQQYLEQEQCTTEP
jgi:WD40 repeat protein/predicted nucleic acid-binding Zn ribbon protein